jgi:DsbC/DsbD-like thiol-disulfide interchange protein
MKGILQMRMVKFAAAALAVVMGALAVGRLEAQPPVAPVFVHASAAAPAAKRGTAVTVTLALTIDKGYHLQGNNAKDPYVPTTVTVGSAPGVTAGKIIYPPAIKKEFTGEVLPVYEGKVLIKVPLTLAKTLKAGTVKVPLTVNYQGCNTQSCYPPSKLSTTASIAVSE